MRERPVVLALAPAADLPQSRSGAAKGPDAQFLPNLARGDSETGPSEVPIIQVQCKPPP
jgi:hypothetical protein